MENVKIPKFGSFKPKSVKRSTDKAAEIISDESRRVNDPFDVHRSRDREGSKRTRNEDKYAHRSKHCDALPGTKHAPGGDELENSNLFLVDRRGDPQNIQYGSIHRFDVPPYYRAGRSGVIGCSPLARIDKTISSDRVVYLKSGGRNVPTETRRPLISKHGKPKESNYQFMVIGSEARDDFDDDFVSLQRRSKRRRLSAESDGDETRHVHPDYRSIEGKAKASTTMDADVFEETAGLDTDEERLDLDLAARLENSRLLRQARAASLNIDPWLELITHQAQLVHAGADASTMTTSQRRSLAELRLSILNEALKHMPKRHAHRGVLLAKSLDEGVFLWDKAKVESRWKEALLDCPDDFQLYQKYLDHVQGEPHGFTFEKCKLAFCQGLKLIANMRDMAQTHGKELNEIKLLTRLIGLIRDSGYDELATAIWQVILEYRFFRPSQLPAVDGPKLLDSLEHFWESDVPRIGEESAGGWKNFSGTSRGCKRVPSASIRPALDTSYLLAAFAREETRISSLSHLPASTDDEDTEDPFRFVMFKDMDDVLDHLGMSLQEDALLNAFLSFHGLPPLATECTENGVWGSRDDPYLTRHNICDVQDQTLDNIHDYLDHLMHSRRETTLLLFHDGFDSFKSRSKMGQQRYSDLITFLDRCLEALTLALPNNEALAEYIIAWKLHVFPEAATKIAKRLLKAKSSSLRLYNAYALLEAALGRLERARDIWQTALSMCSNLAANAQVDRIMLCHSSAYTLAQHGREEAALLSLIRTFCADQRMPEPGESDQISSSQHLRATQILNSEFNRTLVVDDIGHATLYADCLVWLSYLASDLDISVVFARYRHFQDQIIHKAGATAAEPLAQCKVALLQLHLRRKRPFRPAAWEKELGEDLKRYPSNSALLRLHSDVASHDRLRSIMQQQRSPDFANITAVEWLSLISRELQRLHIDGSGSNMNTVRALFGKALLRQGTTVKHSPDLWTLWLCVEYRYAVLAPKNSMLDSLKMAKEVFMNGLRHLPWFKPLALLGMSLFGQEKAYQPELTQIYQTMAERGIRIRIDLDRI